MPQASCVPKKGGDPRLVVSVSLANQSEPIVQGYGALYINIALEGLITVSSVKILLQSWYQK